MDKHQSFQSVVSWSLTVWCFLLNNSVPFWYNLHLPGFFPLPLLLSERVSEVFGGSRVLMAERRRALKPHRIIWVTLPSVSEWPATPSGLSGGHAGTPPGTGSQPRAHCGLHCDITGLFSTAPELLGPWTAHTGMWGQGELLRLIYQASPSAKAGASSCSMGPFRTRAPHWLCPGKYVYFHVP